MEIKHFQRSKHKNISNKKEQKCIPGAVGVLLDQTYNLLSISNPTIGQEKQLSWVTFNQGLRKHPLQRGKDFGSSEIGFHAPSKIGGFL